MSKRIVRLEIENFQSHQHTVIEPAGGLTVITGPSDSGKSAVLRALRWLYRNEPHGTAFIRAGAPRARVTVELEDGVRVSRERSASGSVNRYVIERPGEEALVLEGFGHGVPEPVREALGSREVRIGGEAVDLRQAGQLDVPFLLGAPGSARAEAIGRLTGVHLLSLAAVEAAREEQAAQRQAREARTQLEALEQQLEAYRDLPSWEEALARYEQAVGEAEALAGRLGRLEALQQKDARNRAARAGVDRQLGALARLPEAEGAAEEAGRLAERLGRLQRLQSAYRANARGREEVARTLAATAHLGKAAEAAAATQAAQGRLLRLEQLRGRWIRVQAVQSKVEASARRLAGVDRAQALYREAAEIQQRLQRLEDFPRRIARWKQSMRQVRAALQAAEQQAQQAMEAYRQALAEAGRCPTCGQPVDPERVTLHLGEAV